MGCASSTSAEIASQPRSHHGVSGRVEKVDIPLERQSIVARLSRRFGSRNVSSSHEFQNFEDNHLLAIPSTNKARSFSAADSTNKPPKKMSLRSYSSPSVKDTMLLFQEQLCSRLVTESKSYTELVATLCSENSFDALGAVCGRDSSARRFSFHQDPNSAPPSPKHANGTTAFNLSKNLNLSIAIPRSSTSKLGEEDTKSVLNSFTTELLDLAVLSERVCSKALRGDHSCKKKLDDLLGRYDEKRDELFDFLQDRGIQGRWDTEMQLNSAKVVHKVINGIYLSSQHCAYNRKALDDLGITHVLTCNKEPVQGYYDSEAGGGTGIRHLVFGLRDSADADIFSAFKTAISFVKSTPKVGRNGKPASCLIHCSAGVSRSATIVVAFIMSHYKVSLSHALRLVVASRPIANPNAGFFEQLQRYEMQLNISSGDPALFSPRKSSSFFEREYQTGLSSPALGPKSPQSKRFAVNNVVLDEDEDSTLVLLADDSSPPELISSKPSRPEAFGTVLPTPSAGKSLGRGASTFWPSNVVEVPPTPSVGRSRSPPSFQTQVPTSSNSCYPQTPSMSRGKRSPNGGSFFNTSFKVDVSAPTKTLQELDESPDITPRRLDKMKKATVKWSKTDSVRNQSKLPSLFSPSQPIGKLRPDIRGDREGGSIKILQEDNGNSASRGSELSMLMDMQSLGTGRGALASPRSPRSGDRASNTLNTSLRLQTH